MLIACCFLAMILPSIMAEPIFPPQKIATKQNFLAFVPEIPDQYSITQEQIYKKKQNTKPKIPEDFFVSPSAPQHSPTVVEQKPKQIPAVTIEKTVPEIVPAKPTIVIEKKPIVEIQKVPTLITEEPKKREENLRKQDEKGKQPEIKQQKKQQTNLQNGDSEDNEKQFKFVFSVLLLLAVLVILFGFEKEDASKVILQNKDEDEETLH